MDAWTCSPAETAVAVAGVRSEYLDVQLRAISWAMMSKAVGAVLALQFAVGTPNPATLAQAQGLVRKWRRRFWAALAQTN